MSFLEKIFGAGVVKPIADTISAYFTQRMELRSKERLRKIELDDAIQSRKVELIKAGLTADMNWEMEFAKQASSTWKDEYTLLVVSIPAILAFIPSGATIVANGFTALAATPGWYQLLLTSIFFATYGIRFWRRNQSDT